VREKFRRTLPWPAAHMAYSLIRPKSQIPNIWHDGTLSIGNFMLMMKNLKNFESEPLYPKNVLIASVVHGISCLFFLISVLLVFRKNFIWRISKFPKPEMRIFEIVSKAISFIFLRIFSGKV
jgi:hypothetical protein